MARLRRVYTQRRWASSYLTAVGVALSLVTFLDK